MIEIKEILIKTKELLETKDWCKGSLARDKYGGQVSTATYSEACSFCLLGAIQNSFWADEVDRDIEILFSTYKSLEAVMPKNFRDLGAYNDASETTKDDVLGLLTKAISEL